MNEYGNKKGRKEENICNSVKKMRIKYFNPF